MATRRGVGTWEAVRRYLYAAVSIRPPNDETKSWLAFLYTRSACGSDPNHYATQGKGAGIHCLAAVATILLSLLPAGARADDSYIAGYASAVLQREFKLDDDSLKVKNGVITLSAEDLNGVDQSKIVDALSGISGVTGVDVLKDDAGARRGGARKPAADSKRPPGKESLPTGILPVGHLFKPLLADPRWPHFAASYHAFLANPSGADIATVSFGETIPFYRSNLMQDPSVGQWELGLQAGVFSDFDLSAPSSDLVNADYLGGIYSSLRVGRWSAFGRLFHQSSHLGDEFLLRTRLQRVNLSYEGADLRLSYEFPFGLRIYGGGGGLFARESSELKPWSTQYGFEYRSPWRIDFLAMRPIVAADFKNFEEHKWSTDISARAGVQFDNLNILGRNLQILAEYFNGHSPSGQFYTQKIEYIGLGVHFHF